MTAGDIYKDKDGDYWLVGHVNGLGGTGEEYSKDTDHWVYVGNIICEPELANLLRE